MMKKLRIALIGQGKSGRGIHGKFFLSKGNTFCDVVYVVEADEYRRKKAAAEFGCETLTHYTELFDKKDVDLVVNASYSHLHYPITKDLLEHGFHVLSEKPFGRSYYECLDLIRTAEKNGVMVFAFHQTLLSPAFLNVKKIIASGKLGEIRQINIKYSEFARRWDWQTLQSKCGGNVYNKGPHPIGMALALMNWDKTTKVAFSSLSRVLTSGDSDDFAKIILTAQGQPTVDIEVNSVDAYTGDYIFKVFGSKGTLMSTNEKYQMKYIEDFSAYPERPVIFDTMRNEKGDPVGCSEKLDFVEESGSIEGSVFSVAVRDFYQMIYDTMFEGKELIITPEIAAETIRIIEACHAENPLSVEFE